VPLFLLFGLRWAHTETGKKRAGRLVVAVQAFRNETQKYPENLGEIAPQFIGSVPRSNYPLSDSIFITLLHLVATPQLMSIFHRLATRLTTLKAVNGATWIDA
jgi:hypothetical protein